MGTTGRISGCAGIYSPLVIKDECPGLKDSTTQPASSGILELGGIGIATIKELKDKRELLMAHNAGAAYILYAQGLLPALLPLAVLLIEPTAPRRRRMTAFVVLGCLLSVYMLWGLIAYPLQISALNHTIVYQNAITTTTLVAVLYVIATCGALFFSGFRGLVLLGSVNLVGLLVVMEIRRSAFTSIWCAYAAVVSVIIYFFFRRSRTRPAIYRLAA